MHYELAILALENDSLVDIEAPSPPVFEEFYAFIDDALIPPCDTNHLTSLLTHIENLEEMLSQALTQHGMTQQQVIEVKNQLLMLLQRVHDRIIDADTSADHLALERDFRIHQQQFLCAVGQQQTFLQRVFGLSLLELEAQCERALYGVLVLYVSLGTIAAISLLALIINFGRNQTISNVCSWTLIVTLVPLEIPLFIFYVIYIMTNCCRPFIDYYHATIPENSNITEGRAISASLLGLFAQNKPNTLEDFRNNPSLPLKNIRDIALKLWLSYLATAELLSSEDIRPVLEDYAHYLEANNRSFDQAVEGNFVDRLLTFPVEPGRFQLKSAIISTDEVTQETTLLRAIASVKKANEHYLVPPV